MRQEKQPDENIFHHNANGGIQNEKQAFLYAAAGCDGIQHEPYEYLYGPGHRDRPRLSGSAAQYAPLSMIRTAPIQVFGNLPDVF